MTKAEQFDKAWRLAFKNDDFFKGKVTHFPLGHISQKESVTFKNDSTLYIADELFMGIGRKLYKFKL